MILSHPSWRALTCALLLPLLATAQPRVMTLDELVTAGLANSKQLQIATAKSAAAHARLAQYQNAFVPMLTYTGNYSRLSENVDEFGFTLPDGTYKVLNPIIPNQYSNRLSLSETVFTGLRAVNTIRAAEFLERAASLDADRDRSEVQFNLIGATLNLYKLQQARQTFDQNLHSAQSRLTDLRNQRDQGLVLDNDVLRAELAAAQIESARAETDNSIAAARYALAVLTGLPEQTAIVIDSASVFARTPTVASLSEYLDAAGQRPEVQAARSRAQASDKQVDVSKGVYYPLVTVGGSLFDNRPNQRVFPPEDRFKSTWEAGVTLTWNLSNLYTARKNVEEARFNLVQANLLGDQLSEAARTDISNNYYQLQSAQLRIALAEKTVAQALENRRVMEVRLGQQVNSATDLLDADAQYLQAQINAVQVHADAQLAYFKLLKSTGKL